MCARPSTCWNIIGCGSVLIWQQFRAHQQTVADHTEHSIHQYEQGCCDKIMSSHIRQCGHRQQNACTLNFTSDLLLVSGRAEDPSRPPLSHSTRHSWLAGWEICTRKPFAVALSKTVWRGWWRHEPSFHLQQSQSWNLPALVHRFHLLRFQKVSKGSLQHGSVSQSKTLLPHLTWTEISARSAEAHYAPHEQAWFSQWVSYSERRSTNASLASVLT